MTLLCTITGYNVSTRNVEELCQIGKTFVSCFDTQHETLLGIFYNQASRILGKKIKGNENLHKYSQGRRPYTKDEEKAEVLNAFFVSVFKGKTSYTQGNQSPELVHKDREQHRPLTQEGVVCDVLCHLDTQNSMGHDRIRHLWGCSRNISM